MVVCQAVSSSSTCRMPHTVRQFVDRALTGMNLLWVVWAVSREIPGVSPMCPWGGEALVAHMLGACTRRCGLQGLLGWGCPLL